ncbi:MAG: pentapeptide repeat-containing protein [Anaerolineae bacterium]|nr:pentapeptide repeat-containing protein [Anaerolineae bacterium]
MSNKFGLLLVSLCLIILCLSQYSNQIAAAPDDYISLSKEEALAVLAFPLYKDQIDGYYMPGVDLQNAYLPNARFFRATLVSADLRGAFLTTANFRQADLRLAQLSNADLTFAEFDNANLADADLSESNLFLASFYSANLSGASLRGAKLHGALFAKAILPNGSTYKEGDDLVALFGAHENP